MLLVIDSDDITRVIIKVDDEEIYRMSLGLKEVNVISGLTDQAKDIIDHLK